MLQYLNDTSKVYRFIGNVKADYTLPFFKDITANVNFGLDYSKGEGDKITDRHMPTSTPGFDGAKT